MEETKKDEVKAAETVWSEEDQKWLAEKVPANLHTIALRHGRKLFSLTMQAGAATHCLTVLLNAIQAMEGKRMVTMLSRNMDDLFQVSLKHFGYTVEQFLECKGDVERMVELSEAAKPADKRISKGGIILDS